MSQSPSRATTDGQQLPHIEISPEEREALGHNIANKVLEQHLSAQVVPSIVEEVTSGIDATIQRQVAASVADIFKEPVIASVPAANTEPQNLAPVRSSAASTTRTAVDSADEAPKIPS